MIGVLAGVFGFAFITTAVGCLLMRGIAHKWGYVDKPDIDRKKHETVTPYGGGIAMIVTIVVFCIICILVAKVFPADWLPQSAQEHLAGLKNRLGDFLLIAGAGVFLGLLGLIDDIRPVPEKLKLITELFLGIVIWWVGVRVTLHIPSSIISMIITVLWLVGMANAFNFLDNMDGLSAGVALIASLLFALFGLQTGQLFIVGYFLLIAGISAGFLLYNFPPASMFMGDCGSLLLGFLIAAGAVETTYTESSAYNKILPLLVPLLILALPLFDAFSVIVIRLLKGQPILKADRNHFSHRLYRLGMSNRTIILTIYLVTAGVGMSAFYLIRLSTAESILALAQAVCVFLIIILLEQAGKKHA